MKKILFTLMMLFTLSINVMADDVTVTDKTKKIENVKKIELDVQAAKYDFTVNYRRLGCFLGMSLNQLENFKLFFDKFNENMHFAYYECAESTRDSVVKNIVNKNVKEMCYILNDEQHKKYLILMNTTLRNRGFEF